MSSRRQFLQSAAASAIAAPAVVRGQNLNSKVQLGGIGCEGKGWSDINQMAGHDRTHFAAFCDVDLSRTENVRTLNPTAPVFRDYREMLDRLGNTIDAVTVSTPDHMHAFIGLDAMRRGKHVYCQKPLTHNVWEARQMALQAKQSNVAFRTANRRPWSRGKGAIAKVHFAAAVAAPCARKKIGSCSQNDDKKGGL